MSLNTLMSVAHAGGQGKTTLAQLLYIASKRTGTAYTLAAADFVDDSGHSKIGKLYGDRVEEFGVGAHMTAARTENNLNASLRYWDKLGHVFLTGGHIVDIGANVITGLVQWAQDRRLESLMDRKKSPKLDVFCVCKAEKHAVDDVVKVISSLRAGNAFRINRIFVVQNEAAGGFEGINLPETLGRTFSEMSITFIQLPRCQSEIWGAMERKGVSIERVLDTDEDELCELLDVDIWTASAGLAEIKAWFEQVLKNFRAADALPRREVRQMAANEG